jgi:hypothetical protein
MDVLDSDLIGDFATEPIAGVGRIELVKPDHRLPLPPRFAFGPQPAHLSAGYYKLCSIGTVGVFVLHGVELSGNYLLGRDDRFFRCPELNVHPAHIEAEVQELHASGTRGSGDTSPANMRFLPAPDTISTDIGSLSTCQSSACSGRRITMFARCNIYCRIPYRTS